MTKADVILMLQEALKQAARNASASGRDEILVQDLDAADNWLVEQWVEAVQA